MRCRASSKGGCVEFADFVASLLPRTQAGLAIRLEDVDHLAGLAQAIADAEMLPNRVEAESPTSPMTKVRQLMTLATNGPVGRPLNGTDVVCNWVRRDMAEIGCRITQPILAILLKDTLHVVETGQALEI
eukprot:353892_1